MPTELAPQPLSSVLTNDHFIGIATSRYNDHITNSLCDAAVATLIAAGVPSHQILVVRVPGAWELPFAAQRLVANRQVLGVIALGAVIQGETTHDQHINRAVSSALMQLCLDHNKPIAFGLLTVKSLEQAIQRSGGDKGNKGEECAQALLECLRIGNELDHLQSSDSA